MSLVSLSNIHLYKPPVGVHKALLTDSVEECYPRFPRLPLDPELDLVNSDPVESVQVVFRQLAANPCDAFGAPQLFRYAPLHLS